MKRVLFFLLILSFFLFTPPPASAATTCDVTTDTVPVDTNESAITLTINYSPGFATGNEYWVKLDGIYVKKWSNFGPLQVKEVKKFDHQGNTIIVPEVDANANLIDSAYPNGSNFKAKNYTVTVTTVGGLTAGQIICSGDFTVEQASSGVSDSCTGIEFLNPDFRPMDNIRFKIEPASQSGLRNVVVKRGGQFGNTIIADCKRVSELTNPGGYDLGAFDVVDKYTNYFLEIQSEGFLTSGKADCGVGSKTVCYANFTICADCKSPGKGQGGKPEAPSPVKCNGDANCLSCVEDEKNPKGIPTPLGCVKTSPSGLVGFILKFLLYTAGGIAVLLIMFGGYNMMTSQGNPEKLQGAQETITSAIVGLLFIIFSLVLLEIIGVDILRIPGFTK